MPGKFLLRLMSELKLLLKYCEFSGSRLFFDLLSEMKFTLELKSQYGLDLGNFRWFHVMLNLLLASFDGKPLLNR